MAKGKSGLPDPGIPLDFYTPKQLKTYVQNAGKTAQARLRTLEKAYAPGGSMEGRKSYVLERFEGLNAKTAGLSEKALRLKAQQIQDLLSAKSSTIKGVKEIDQKRLDAFKENHPNYKINVLDKDGNVKLDKNEQPVQREPSKAEWLRAMQILGKIQKAEKGAGYDSNEQLFMALKLASGKDTGIIPKGKSDSVDADSFLTESGDMAIHSNMFFSQADLSETLAFMNRERE